MPEGEPFDRRGTLEVLLRAGATIDARDSEGKTALMKAGSSTEIVTTLLVLGADPNAVDHEGRTALFYATPGMIEPLLAAGADPWIRDREGLSPLVYHRFRPTFGYMARVFFERAVFREQAELDNALCRAAAAGDVSGTAELLRRGAAADARDVGTGAGRLAGTGDTALLIAVREGQLEVSRTLLDAGGHPDYPEARSRGLTPLMQAAADGRVDLARLLIDAGADVRAETREGETALQLATARRHPEVAELLLDALVR